MAKNSQKKWVISDSEDDDEEIGVNVRELFALIKRKQESDPHVNNSESTEANDWHTANEEFDTSQASSQLTTGESDAQYFTPEKDNNPNTLPQKPANVESISSEEDSDGNIRPKIGQRRLRLVVYDDTDEDSRALGISEEEENTRKNLISDEESVNEISEENTNPVVSKSRIIKPARTKKAFQNKTKKNWWEQYEEPIPEIQKCKINECSFAPHPHERHVIKERNYSDYETRLIIKYLIHYKVIQYGKGLQVWKDFNALGYLTHRSVDSLNNHFKKYLLRDIKKYKLPKDIEDQFLKVRVPSKNY